MKTIHKTHYLTKEDLQQGLHGIERYRAHTQGPPLFFRMTSGTSRGVMTMLVVGHPDKKQYEHYENLFDGPLVIVHPKHCTVMQWIHHFVEHTEGESRIMFLDRKTRESHALSHIFETFGPRNIYGFPALLDALLNQLTRAHVQLGAGIRKIHLTGERISKALLKKFESWAPQSSIAVVYATAEARVIATPCPHLEKRYPDLRFQIFHPVDSTCIEIVTPDEHGMGEIAVSTPELPHYLTGDAGTLTEELCSCGARFTLCVHGRINFDVISCVGALFLLSEVELVFSLLGMYVSDYYVEVKEVYDTRKTYGTVTFYIVPTDALRALKDGDTFVLTYIARHLQVTKTRTLEDLIAADIFLHPEVAFVFSLPISGKKVRMKKIEV